MKPVRYGMVGGGPGAFIGAVHRSAAALDGCYRLVAGALSGDPDRAREGGAELRLDPERTYVSFARMAEEEARREDGIELVSIVTPNHLHYPAARAFLEAGIHVVCDKPLTHTLDQAEHLCRLTAKHARTFCVTYTYSGYPMVKEARERVRAGALGRVRKVVVEYAQGWLSTLLEETGQKQAEWRADPARAGASSALGDIGTHAHHLVGYVTGLEAERLFADLGTLVPGRALEDDATVLLRYKGGARGLLMASQMSTGERNGLRLRVYGTEGSLDWRQERPDELRLLAPSGTETVLHRGSDGLSAATAAHTRLPSGHPEGFIEAFANLYRNVAHRLRSGGSRGGAGAAGAGVSGDVSPDSRATPDPLPEPASAFDFPTVQDGARGVHFVHAALQSAEEGGWVDAAYTPPEPNP